MSKEIHVGIVGLGRVGGKFLELGDKIDVIFELTGNV